MENNLGVSIYFSNNINDNLNLLKRAVDNDIKYVFTSLHVLEENIDINDVKKVIKFCKDNNLKLIIDVSPNSLKLLNIEDIRELLNWGIEYIRLDFGYEIDEIIELSNEFKIVLNASTITETLLNKLDTSRLLACHNYYPLPYSGLSIEHFNEINELLNKYNVKILSFAVGDSKLRGPINAKLPTIENHRNLSPICSMIELFALNSSIVIFSDYLSDESWRKIEQLKKGIYEISTNLNDVSWCEQLLLKDRMDYSEYYIRFSELRGKFNIDNDNKSKELKPGDIAIYDNSTPRYFGEVIIILKNFKSNNLVKIGEVSKDNIEALKYYRGELSYILRKGC